ncbi:MAG: YdiU family protein [Alphaproteobacteria bacterium]|nr:YdiU family protein [Alphaproteobacteria bacterium]
MTARQIQFGFNNSYRRLPDRFHARLPPEPVADPRLVALNRPLAEVLGLDVEAIELNAAMLFSGNALPTDAEPLAAAYAGHQFGHFVPQLGDGRAILIGELIGRDGQRRDIQLKGSGQTPFSRRGDGRAALGPVLREYLVSEAMHALGVPTTRSLAVVTTGEPVYREDVLPGAVLTRVAASHVRVGTFQYFAVRSDRAGVQLLADYVIRRHYPEVEDAERPTLALLAAVAERQAALVARWMGVGFIHGVMNTDNMAISGETIDYGPCAFMDAYDPATVFSAIDQGGRYAYANQPGIAQWNLARFAETLLPLIDPDGETAMALATEAVEGFADRFERHWLAVMRAKIGLATAEPDDRALVLDLLKAMHAGSADFTLAFRRLCDWAADDEAREPVRQIFAGTAGLDAWEPRWRARLAREGRPARAIAAAMRLSNPAIIPRNHRVEQALAAAVQHGDLMPFEALFQALQDPYSDDHAAAYAAPPLPSERVCRTFCGT